MIHINMIFIIWILLSVLIHFDWRDFLIALPYIIDPTYDNEKRSYPFSVPLSAGCPYLLHFYVFVCSTYIKPFFSACSSDIWSRSRRCGGFAFSLSHCWCVCWCVWWVAHMLHLSKQKFVHYLKRFLLISDHPGVDHYFGKYSSTTSHCTHHHTFSIVWTK